MGAKPEPWLSLRRDIKQLRELIRAMRNASPFEGTGIHPTGNGGMESDDFDGDLDAGDVGTKGWAFNGFRVAIGELLLRPGSIGNETLTNPVFGDVDSGGSGVNFSVSTTSSAKYSGTIGVPTGFTRAVVLCSASVTAYNGTASFDYLTVQAAVNGVSGGSISVPVNSGEANGVTANRTSVLNGLTGGSTISVQAFAGTTVGTWPVDVTNIATVNALAIFTR